MFIVQSVANAIAQRMIREKEEETAMIDNALHEMSDSDRYIFWLRYDAEKKSAKTAYYYLIGGAHYLYLERPTAQLFFWITLGGGLAWFAISAVTMDLLVDKYNRDLAFTIIADVWNQSVAQCMIEAESDAAQHPSGELTFVAPETPTPIKLIAHSEKSSHFH